MLEELPAVTVPPSLNAVRSFDIASIFTLGRKVSSLANTISGVFLVAGIVTGIISLPTQPLSQAAAAIWWLRIPHSSCSLLLILYFTDKFSAVIPIPIAHNGVT